MSQPAKSRRSLLDDMASDLASVAKYAMFGYMMKQEMEQSRDRGEEIVDLQLLPPGDATGKAEPLARYPTKPARSSAVVESAGNDDLSWLVGYAVAAASLLCIVLLLVWPHLSVTVSWR